MLNKMYRNIDVLKSSLDLSWKKNEIISNNISNVNTPGYKRMTIEFDKILKSNLHKDMDLKTTSGKHITTHGKTNEFKIKRSDNFSTKKDGNNVNIDVEMAELTKNTIFYNTLSKQVSNEFNKIRMVINEGR